MAVTFHKNVDSNETDSADNPQNAGFVENLKQQRLPGQFPLVSRRLAISTTVSIGIIFIGIALLLHDANMRVILIKKRYDNETSGSIQFRINKQIPNPVYFYYEIKNSFLNHRSLNSAFCKTQLFGGMGYTDSLEACDSFKNRNYSCEDPREISFDHLLPPYCTDKKFYAPIGALPAIMFNDSFVLERNGVPFSWHEEGVVEEKTRSTFLHPDDDGTDICKSKMFKNTVKPKQWKNHICEMGGYRNISFIKWMEASAYKDFKKLYRILNATKHRRGLLPGMYTLHFDNIYWPVNSDHHKYSMQKYFWILHPSWVGSEQYFLEYMYLTVGMLILILSVCIVLSQILYFNKLRGEERTRNEEDEEFDF